MSGVEVAGLVLGALPLLLKVLQSYAEGIDATKRYWRYREEVKSLLDDLRAELAVYQNSIEILLVCVVEAKDAVPQFLANPGGELWKAASFERRLRSCLGTSYEPYLDTIDKLHGAVEDFGELLKLGSWSQPQFAHPQAFKEHYKRLKFSLNKSAYDGSMDTIRKANTVLHRLTFQRQNIESQRTNRASIPNYKNINEQAQDFFSILSSGWTCSCQADHAVSLRLEPRIDDVSYDDEDPGGSEVSMRSPFHVLFQYGYRRHTISTMSKRPWTWDEADIRVTCLPARAASTTPQCSMHSDKSVQFASCAKRAVQATLELEPNLRPIKDLCAAIGTLQKSQRDICFTLLEKELSRQRYGLEIRPTKTLPHDTEQWSVCTLRSALQRKRRFPMRDRVRLAVILASSVLQLHETPWLDDDWDIDSIYFVDRPGAILYDQPFVLKGSGANVPYSTAAAIPKHLKRVVQNQPLFALGVALIELWYGESLSELYEDEDGPQDPIDEQATFFTRLNAAYRLADELEGNAGAKYSDAVRRCIRCDFSMRTNSLEDVQFQKAVFQGVVAQLKATHDFLV